MNVYDRATKRPHGYLILDAKANTSEENRFITNIFPDDGVSPRVEPQLESIKRAASDETNHLHFRSREERMDFRDIVPCNYCGLLFDDIDNLQEHLYHGCSKQVKKVKMEEENALTEENVLFDADENDGYIDLYNDVIESLEGEKDRLETKYAGLDRDAAKEKIKEKLHEKYRKKFFDRYRQMLHLIMELDESKIHNKIIEGIKESGTSMDKAIPMMVAKYAYAFESFLEEDSEEEDSQKEDTEDEDSGGEDREEEVDEQEN
jgi:flagellar biosynthesis/type III secretory pathway chaperone